MGTKLIILGGFLGAGKTTLMLAAAKQLTARGLRVGLITNDQGHDLVDTAMATAQQVPVTEVAGGCFCCRFPDLLQALFALQKQVQPDVILAEPVGSCTDLMATVLLPLQRFYHDVFRLAPLSVLVDTSRDTTSFSSVVNYLYAQQLAEAEYLLLNKIDKLSSHTLDTMQVQHPGAVVMGLSARDEQGVEEWLDTMLQTESRLPSVLEIDYGRYGEAEAELGWLNYKVAISAGAPFAADKWVTALLRSLQETLQDHGAAIAHIKIHLLSAQVELKASVTSEEAPPYWDRWSPQARVEQAHLLLNARVACDPDLLDKIVRQTLAMERPRPDYRCEFLHAEAFRPAAPEPTHRLTLAV